MEALFAGRAKVLNDERITRDGEEASGLMVGINLAVGCGIFDVECRQFGLHRVNAGQVPLCVTGFSLEVEVTDDTRMGCSGRGGVAIGISVGLGIAVKFVHDGHHVCHSDHRLSRLGSSRCGLSRSRCRQGSERAVSKL